MLVKRTTEIETSTFNVEDIISFELSDGEQVDAMAVKSRKTVLSSCSWTV